jgi:hypothetical protein
MAFVPEGIGSKPLTASQGGDTGEVGPVDKSTCGAGGAGRNTRRNNKKRTAPPAQQHFYPAILRLARNTRSEGGLAIEAGVALFAERPQRLDVEQQTFTPVSGSVLTLAISLENRVLQEFQGEIRISVYRSLPDEPPVSRISGTFLRTRNSGVRELWRGVRREGSRPRICFPSIALPGLSVSNASRLRPCPARLISLFRHGRHSAVCAICLETGEPLCNSVGFRR